MDAQVVSLPEEIASILIKMDLQHLYPEWTIQETADNIQVNLKWRKQPASTVSSVTISSPTVKSRSKLERDRKRHDTYMERNSLFRHNDESISLSPQKANTVTTDARCSNKATPMFSDASCQYENSMSVDTGTMTNQTSFLNVESQTTPIERETATLMKSTTTQSVIVSPSSTRCTEKVLKRRVKNNRPEFLIKWQNLPSNKNTWVPEAKLDSFAIEYLKTNEKLVPGPKPYQQSPYEARATYMEEHRARMRHVVHMRDNPGFHFYN